MLPRITFNPGLPQALRELVEMHIAQVAGILSPGWLAEIEVCHGFDPDRSLAVAISVDFAYRRACLYVHDGFVSIANDSERRRFIIHEFCHLYTSPIKEMAQRMVDQTWEPGSSSRKIWENEFNQCLEGSTVDLENLVVRLLDQDDIPQELFDGLRASFKNDIVPNPLWESPQRA